MNDAVITITGLERMQLEAILLDDDVDAAMTLLKQIKQRIEDSERKGMRSHLDSR